MAPETRAKPSVYPPLPFHVVRSAQLISSLIVGGIMAYFLKELQHDHYRLPWTFVLLLCTCLLSLLALLYTFFLHGTGGLKPLLSLSLNSILLVLWTLSFALLTWWSSGTLGHVCNRVNWDNPTGIKICRIYKALFSFTLIGFLATGLALGLDVKVWRNEGRRGKFTSLEQRKDKGAIGASEQTWGEGEQELNPNLTVRTQRGVKRGGDGYAVPEEQFVYEDDTSYRGAAGQAE